MKSVFINYIFDRDVIKRKADKLKVYFNCV